MKICILTIFYPICILPSDGLVPYFLSKHRRFFTHSATKLRPTQYCGINVLAFGSTNTCSYLQLISVSSNQLDGSLKPYRLIHCIRCLTAHMESMGNGAASRAPKIRHDVTFPLLTQHRGTWSCRSTFFYRIYPKENIIYTGVLQICH
jgi:hypothetical protein